MKLSDKQKIFARNMARLVEHIFNCGYSCTIGEVHRTPAQQRIYIEKGRSRLMNSMHLKKLACDLYIFDSDGNLTWDEAEIRPFGTFWEGLNENNRWGGNWQSFKDVPHFEMQG